MPSVAPVASVAFVVEAISGLQRLQREMARVSQRDENYESKKRALQATIQELRKIIPANQRQLLNPFEEATHGSVGFKQASSAAAPSTK
jgi:hypothetical protein